MRWKIRSGTAPAGDARSTRKWMELQEEVQKIYLRLTQLQHQRSKTVELLTGEQSTYLEYEQRSRLQELLTHIDEEIIGLQRHRAGVQQQEGELQSRSIQEKRETKRFTLYRFFLIILIISFLAVGFYNALQTGDITSAAVAAIDISAPREHYLATEEPLFEVEIPEIKSPLTGFFILSPVKVQLKDPLGRVLEVEKGLGSTKKNNYISFSPSASFRAGKYSLQLLRRGELLQEQNFTWGVLALNPDKSAYREGEKAFIGIAVLDDQGATVCNAEVVLEVIAPDGAVTRFNTDSAGANNTGNGSITVSKECEVYGVTNLPDYYATYAVGKEEGLYQLHLTAILPGGESRSITDVLRVNNSMPFYVTRKGPTRIYPYDTYKMEIIVEAQREFTGEIQETVPASFFIAPQEDVDERFAHHKDVKILSWNAQIALGKTHTLFYTFDAPDISPEMHLLGPLQLLSATDIPWKESRQWQIAADVLTGVTLDTPVANMSNLTSQEFTFTCKPTCDGVSDPASIGVTYRYSPTPNSNCSFATPIETNTGTSDVLSVDAQNDTTTCGNAISGLVTARNVGTVYISCLAGASGQGEFQGGCREVLIAQGCGGISSNVNVDRNLGSSGTCFTVNANNIVINCTNYEISYGAAGTADTYGINIDSGEDNVTIKNCVLREASASGNNKYSIFAQNGALGTKISNSSIITSGQGSTGIALQSGSNSTNITDVNITTTGVNGEGISLFHSSHNVITAVLIRTAAGKGVTVASAHNNTLSALNITMTGALPAVVIDDPTAGTGMSNNIFYNLTAWAAINYTFFDNSGGSANNTLIYNSTFGVINWTSINLTTNTTLWQGITIFTNNRTLGVLDNGALMERINTTAKIVFRTLTYLTTPFLLKGGERCDGTIHCNITQDYDKSVGVLSVNVSSFSNYTLNSPATHNVPVLNTTNPSNNNTNQNLTFYPQNISDPDQNRVKNITNWLVNGTSIIVLNMPFERVNVTSARNAWDYAFLNNASEQNGAIWNATGGYDQRGAYRFDGTNDFLEIPSGEKISHGVLNFTGNFSIVLWIYRDASSTGYEHLVSKSSDAAFDYFLSLSNSALHAGFTDSGGTTQNLTGNGAIPAGRWHHLAVTFNGTTLTGYVNAILNQTSGVTPPLRSSGVALRAGRFLDGNGFNGHIDELQIYNRSLTATQIRVLFENRSDLIASTEITSGQNWTADVTPNDGFADGITRRSNQVIVIGVANALPTAPAYLTIGYTNTSSITNRTPIFVWQNSTDADGDIFSYHLQVDDSSTFNNPEMNVSAVQTLRITPENTTYFSSVGTVELGVDTTFFWRVRANDSGGFGSFSGTYNFTLDSLLSVSLLTSAVEFGSLAPGSQQNTSDGSPAPFNAENNGNIDVNASINGSRYFDNADLNTSNYQFRIRENEANAFSTALSDTNWRNMSKNIFGPNVVNLTWRDARNDFFVDINVTVPTDEPSGLKSSRVTFTFVANQ